MQRALSFRILMVGMITAGAVAWLAGLMWEPLMGVVFWPVFVVFMVSAVLNDANVLYCPFCRKRVKIGAGACHHCGRSVTP